MSIDPAHIEQLRHAARYARERHELYRARAYGSRPTSLTRLRELEHQRRQAEERLAHALREQAAAGGGEGPTADPPGQQEPPSR